jgi:hypothetical protein
LRDAGSDRIEIDVDTACEDRRLVEQRLRLESTLPKAALALVFPIGPACDRLAQASHELVLLDEDPQALEDRREAWHACLLPDNDVEQRLVENAVVYTWLQDRARRAQASRINANMINDGVDQRQTIAMEVDRLGRRLFKDRCGPLLFYPSPSLAGRDDFSRDASTSFPERGVDDPDQPSTLVVSLQSTLVGCKWMLAEWVKLKAILEQGHAWLSSDKLKAVRLLGKQPFDAIDDRDVAMAFMASFVLKPDKSAWYWEIAMELADKDIKRFRNSAAVRDLESLEPEDATKAREALLGIIERATERLSKTAETHRERAQLLAALARDLLAFDDSLDGERLALRTCERQGPVPLAERPGQASPFSSVRGQWSVVHGRLQG